MYRENTAKKRLAEGKKVLGCWLQGEGILAAELIGYAGFDFAIIDHEHAPGSFVSAISLIQAVSASGTTVMMRVPWNDPVYLKRALDIGIEGVMIPMVETAEQARAAVAACRFPPYGIRGNATGGIRGADFGLSQRKYLDTAHEQLLIMCQVETVKTVENIPEIAQVEGVDVLFIGPNDLASSIGKPSRFDDPEVMALLERAETAIKAAGKRLAAVPFGPYGWQDLFDRGYDLVVGAGDLALVRMGALAQVKAHRAKNG
ncbi:MAG TPA: aldolase/citrate lyase family protein [Alphaproteobacteria bacterium]|nr:aldolase/citrate lyase family protein [Alphaproteobacteria bacterium]